MEKFQGKIQVDEKRLIDQFLELVHIDSPSKNERQVADYLKARLSQLGLEVYEDDAGQSFGGNTGNVIGILRGNQQAKAVMFCAHMDTVVSNQGVKPVVDEEIIRTEGKSILGGDDKGGIAAILETLQIVRENSSKHGDIYIIFTVGEEIGLFGAKNLDLSRINVEVGFVLDSGGPVGTIIYTAPTEEDITIKIHGKAAHSGVEPEKGINAIQIAGKILARLPLGRIDGETTANIGIIKGGSATNIIPDYLEMHGEVRSRNQVKLDETLKKIERILEETCNQENAKFEINKTIMYKGFCLGQSNPVIKTVLLALDSIGLKGQLLSRGGGSDANIFNAGGMSCVNLGIGMTDDHTNKENIKIIDLKNAVKLLLAIIANTIRQDFL